MVCPAELEAGIEPEGGAGAACAKTRRLMETDRTAQPRARLRAALRSAPPDQTVIDANLVTRPVVGTLGHRDHAIDAVIEADAD